MNIKLLLFISLIVVPVAYAKTVYKTVDAEGNIVFSDVPSEGAEEIKIKEAQAINPPKARSFKLSPPEDSLTKFQYTKLAITSPENDSTIHGGEGNVSITVVLEPELTENDVMALFMDGIEIRSGRDSQFLLENVDRGTHSIYVVVKNEVDKALKRSAKVTFHVRRVSQLSPELKPNPEVVTPLNPPKTPKPDVSPTNPPKPVIPKS
ncbi:MAG: penicillin-binding protein [marine bacterium B5-7]|nr:MAG: penicillin-binding protein [marine bacterium B5-7]